MAFDADHDGAGSTEPALADAFRDFIADRAFPCVGAKSALGKGQMRILTGRDIRSGWNDLPVHAALHAFAQGYKRDPRLFQSFAVVFEGPVDLSEAEFEHHMWARIQSLTDKDVWRGAEADPRVDASPDSPHFSLSFGGEAFFAVGLHPHASRDARRFRAPTIVFNLHDQFERLRAEGAYEKLRGAILQRDEALQGSINPMLARHGEGGEARQYSGRRVDEAWRCPMRPRAAAAGGAARLEVADLLP